ncbi:flagellar hook-length control protein FliK [Paenibacillus macerans]|uniref:flagellar hook-length control protein FliK n=1 Tax=Paenibacillus macerans TaxID=44252 RepID=UPI000DF962F1|nr:flagellar hook-length control protein FliK [Paenibacillus macerans]SUA82772.1 DNA ligase 1 [Paenibacillus macerans]
MNIGPLLRSMMGNAQAGEPKTLELKTGQVVRGTVLSVSENGQEAVIQVQGVKLHAALETPMRPGETTLLQVQPESKDGLAVLRPMSSLPGAELSAASLAKALQSLGLEDTATNRELLQLMQKSGLPLTKENVSQILQVSGQKPGGVPLSEWIQAAGIAFSRGLPLTGETVAGLHQAVFGPPLHALLSALDEQIANFLSQTAGNLDGTATPGSGTSGGSAGGAAALGQQAQAGSNAATLTDTASSGSGAAAMSAAAGGAGAAGASAQPNQAAGLVQMALRGALAEAAEGQTPQPGTPGGSAAASLSGGALVAKLQAVLAVLDAAMLQEGMAEAAPGRGTGAGGAAPSAGTLGGSGAAAGGAAAAPQAQGEGAAGPSPAGTRPTPAAEPWVGRVLKLLGAEHEQQVRAAAPSAAAAPAQAQEAPPAAGASAKHAGGAELPGGQAPGSAPAAAPGGATGGAAPASTPAPASAGEAAAMRSSAFGVSSASAAPNAAGGAAQDTLKGLLLQIAAADDLPAPLQEAARQLVQQLTGQQLLLNTDRTAPFAQVTMFLPFFGPDGKQTASVHIESRRGRKGELDPANCRLWFDLQMKTLGQIMVDVQVADKKVLLKIFSEQEATGAFLESRQEEISEALSSAGYRLLSLKSEPLIPKESEEGGAADFSLPLTYAPSPYKGVDYRV